MRGLRFRGRGVEHARGKDQCGARVHGDVAIVTGVLHLKGLDHGKPYLRSGRFVDTWLYKNARWVCVSSETTPLEQK